jgi:hypothetical protein
MPAARVCDSARRARGERRAGPSPQIDAPPRRCAISSLNECRAKGWAPSSSAERSPHACRCAAGVGFSAGSPRWWGRRSVLMVLAPGPGAARARGCRRLVKARPSSSLAPGATDGSRCLPKCEFAIGRSRRSPPPATHVIPRPHAACPIHTQNEAHTQLSSFAARSFPYFVPVAALPGPAAAPASAPAAPAQRLQRGTRGSTVCMPLAAATRQPTSAFWSHAGGRQSCPSTAAPEARRHGLGQGPAAVAGPKHMRIRQQGSPAGLPIQPVPAAAARAGDQVAGLRHSRCNGARMLISRLCRPGPGVPEHQAKANARKRRDHRLHVRPSGQHGLAVPPKYVVGPR